MNRGRRGERGASLALRCRAQRRPGIFRPAAGSCLLQLRSSIHNSDYVYITPSLVFASLYLPAFASINWFCLSAITLAKSTIFFPVLLVGLFVHFDIILLGFVAGKFSFISDVEARGLGTFVGTFSLPALVFVSLCQLDFTSVNWVFLSAITLAKSTIFFLVLLVGLFVHRPADPSRSEEILDTTDN